MLSWPLNAVQQRIPKCMRRDANVDRIYNDVAPVESFFSKLTTKLQATLQGFRWTFNFCEERRQEVEKSGGKEKGLTIQRAVCFGGREVLVRRVGGFMFMEIGWIEVREQIDEEPKNIWTKEREREEREMKAREKETRVLVIPCPFIRLRIVLRQPLVRFV